MRKGKNTLLLLAISASVMVQAQGMGEIQGKVREADGPVPGALITARQGEHVVSTVSDIDGRFVLKPLPAGGYAVSVTSMSMQPQEFTDVIVSPDNITRMKEIELRVAELGPIIVFRTKWEKPMIDHDNTGVTQVSHRQFTHNPNEVDPVKLIEQFAPGVVKAPNGDGLFFRGARAENMCYYVDGMKIGSGLSGVPNEAINSFSVYTGGVPAKYGDVTGGIVAIETKSYFDLYQQRNAGVQ